jgi:glycosyltransferase involved in cell wall biosynthesis
MKQNLTLVNSDWTGRKVRERYGIETTTLYPPVPGDFPDVPWHERENGFVCIGRWAPEKKLESLVEILAAVRSTVSGIHLHIVGTAGTNRDYCQRVRRLAADNAGWVSLHENLPRAELVRLVSSQRYGIHGMPEEHFGIAVAEMVRAGCIVFVPDSGGQVEIVGGEDRLRYKDARDAVGKIVGVLSNPGEQAALGQHLAARKHLFGADQFMRRLREIVTTFAAGRGDSWQAHAPEPASGPAPVCNPLSRV